MFATGLFALSLAATAVQEPRGAPAQAVDGPLGLVAGSAVISMWIGQPYEVSPGVYRVWWWSFGDTPLSDGQNRAAFQYEVHCHIGQLRQTRFELYADSRFLSASDQTQPLHEPVDRWADPDVMARVCGGVQPTVTVSGADEAARHFGR